MADIDIAGNFFASEKLKELLAKGEAIAFVGAGASAELYGVWQDIISYLVGAAKTRGLASDDYCTFWLRHASSKPQHIVRQIKHSLGEAIYHQVLRSYFSHRKQQAGGRNCTKLQEAIVSLPFRGIITTNYDPGLYEARCLCRPDLEHSDGKTWEDGDYSLAWYKQEVFQDRSCPIFYAHGKWDRPETVILDNDRYRRAYAEQRFRAMFEHIWIAQKLVIIGVGFADSWLDRVLDELLPQMSQSSEPRHIAVIGLHREEKGYAGALRDLMQNAYNALALFYEIDTQEVDGKLVDNHHRLITLLNEIQFSLRGPSEEIRQPLLRTSSAMTEEAALKGYSMNIKNGINTKI